MMPPPPSRRLPSLGSVRLDLTLQDRFTPAQRRAVTAFEAIAQVFGATAAVLRYGLHELTDPVAVELGAVVVGSLSALFMALIVRDRASLARDTFRERNRFRFTLAGIWLAISAAIFGFGPELLGLPAGTTRLSAFFVWSDLVIVARAVIGTAGATRGVTAGAFNPALLLIGSFALLITIGTLLLLLPRCRAADAPDVSWPERIRIAAFTATSASCVTGLIVVPTGGDEAYWSRTGQAVILGLFQVGGLGIMTCGAFFALTTSRSMRLREAATLRELFDPGQPINVRRLVFSILAFTFGSELVGALLLSTLWADKPFGEQAFFSVFHSVSAFCNAGFDLTGESFLGQGGRWQVWGVVAGLIILGGLGFGTLYNIAHAGRLRLRRGRHSLLPDGQVPFGTLVASGRTGRLTVTTRLVLVTTAILLVAGTAWYFFFEATRGGTAEGVSFGRRLGDAWFQSVTYRTAGFNTVDHADLRPATKLFAVVLMFIGASPVSTGGGVKTAAVAVAVLAIASIMRGRMNAEAFGRAISDDVVKRALTVIALYGAMLITVNLFLAAFEDDARIAPINLLYESASACGTVGVSTGITDDLTPASQIVLIAAMFLGRIGPLTLLLGLAGQRHTADYSYPEERVTLG